MGGSAPPAIIHSIDTTLSPIANSPASGAVQTAISASSNQTKIKTELMSNISHTSDSTETSPSANELENNQSMQLTLQKQQITYSAHI